MEERKPKRPPSLYRMNKAASMRLEESRRKLAEVTEPIRRRTVRRATRKVRRTSSRGSSHSSRTAPLNRVVVQENFVPLGTRNELLQQREPRRMAPAVQFALDKTFDMRDRGSHTRTVWKSEDISLSGVSAVIEESVKTDFIQISEILIDELDTSPTQNDETQEEEKGWKVVNCLKALKNTIFKEKDEIEGTQQTKATQVGRTEGVSCSSGLCQRTTVKSEKNPVFVQTERENEGQSSNLPRRMDEMDSARQLAPSILPRPILKTERKHFNSQDNLRTFIDTSPKNNPAGHATSVTYPAPPGVKILVDNTNIVCHTDAGGVHLGNKTLKDYPKTVTRAPTVDALKSPVARRASSALGPSAALPSTSSSPRSIPPNQQKSSAATTPSESRADHLGREGKLQAIRRLEEKITMKQKELDSTRKQLRLSLEEEMENNMRLESILEKIKAIRKAGEKGAFLEGPDKYLRQKGKGVN